MGRTSLLFLLLAAVAGSVAYAATPVWITPDVPTTEALNGTTLLPWEIYRYDGASYTPVLSVPGNPDLNAIHKMDLVGDWLFSVEAPSDLGGALMPAGAIAEPRDVIRFDFAAGVYTICFSGAAAGVPPGTNVDSVYLQGGDTGDLIVSFDVPTDIPPFIGPTAFEPSDLVQFAPIVPGIICPGWAIVAANPVLDGTTTLPPIPITTSTDGGDSLPTGNVLAFDVPTDLPPFAGPAAFTPGDLVEWDAVAGAFALFVPLGGWPISSIVDGVSCGGSTPGRVLLFMTVGKAAAPPGIIFVWPGSCLSGGQDYGIYEGMIGAWYSHVPVACVDLPPVLTEPILPAAPDSYYLVVPQNTCRGVEGSYGRCSPGICLPFNERPVGAVVCAAPQVLPPPPPACP
jgi:hypothetical protein